MLYTNRHDAFIKCQWKINMILRSSPPSPFGRKIKIAIAVLGLSDKITVEMTDTMDPEDSIRGQNPLGKIPALVLDDGTVIYDSRVVAEYLDYMAGGGKIIPTSADRFPALTMQALADGIMDAGILQVYEVRFRPEEIRHPDWLAYQAEKVTRALTVLEAAPPAMEGTPHIGHIALACALGYQDFRFHGTWRGKYPNLVAWLDEFADKVPAFAATMPPV